MYEIWGENLEVKPFSFDKRYADPNVNKKKLLEQHIQLCLTRFNVLKTLHIYPLNDCLLLLMKPDFKKPKLCITNPQTPEFIRRLKIRNKNNPPTNVKSFADIENEEVDKMKKYKFKAAPAPKTGKSKVSIKKSTKPPTKPVTPKISRGKKRPMKEEVPIEFKAQPVPSFIKPALPAKTGKKNVEVKPFSFDKRYADPNVNKKKLLEQHMSDLKKNAEFKANPYSIPAPIPQK